MGAVVGILVVLVGLPLLIVARAALGTINHTLLTAEAADRRGLTLAGVVISHADGPLSAADGVNLTELRTALEINPDDGVVRAELGRLQRALARGAAS